MNIRASGRSALIIAAGLWLGFAGPMRATDSAAEPAGTAAENGRAPVNPGTVTKHRPHKRHVSHARKPAKPEAKADTKAHETAHETTASAAQDSDKQIPLPPTIANANAKAEMPGTTEDLSKQDLPKTEASALASNAGQMLSGNQGDPGQQTDSAPSTAEIVSPDEFNEIDRALADDKQAAPHLALASIDTAASTSNADTGQAAANDGSAWNQTSLIGKIFIAFGGLLMFGSAARMFMA
ncbi:conserved hypothetical protein [Nitrobacter hamburgensis X14]|uniref:Uncharacterized protein n=1 Tax=Nitrobacter hamburgensis (strain DSM 10229 / NCIMB 13809 / X14) TaxID=323097 RepID=Q1QK07_NITHX|nr:hypothetical protein [Nitrobacter hamburgensis]ABE63440.1 conserved hypothetical protein [Nitrobacter hamburgensis X14]